MTCIEGEAGIAKRSITYSLDVRVFGRELRPRASGAMIQTSIWNIFISELIIALVLESSYLDGYDRRKYIGSSRAVFVLMYGI
jgi:hypothetical protein